MAIPCRKNLEQSLSRFQKAAFAGCWSPRVSVKVELQHDMLDKMIPAFGVGSQGIKIEHGDCQTLKQFLFNDILPEFGDGSKFR